MDSCHTVYILLITTGLLSGVVDLLSEPTQLSQNVVEYNIIRGEPLVATFTLSVKRRLEVLRDVTVDVKLFKKSGEVSNLKHMVSTAVDSSERCLVKKYCIDAYIGENSVASTLIIENLEPKDAGGYIVRVILKRQTLLIEEGVGSFDVNVRNDANGTERCRCRCKKRKSKVGRRKKMKECQEMSGDCEIG
ncbi:uncharacterized protein LOC144440497 [Glandiceps talaboti]